MEKTCIDLWCRFFVFIAAGDDPCGRATGLYKMGQEGGGGKI